MPHSPSTVRVADALTQGHRGPLTIGVAEAIGAGLLLSPRGRLVGVGILIVVMLGAIYSHLASGFGSPVHAARNTGLLVLVAVLHELHRRRQ